MASTARFDSLIVLFFLMHIPTTIFIDSQGLFPKGWYPSWALKSNSEYIRILGDPLMKDMPLWFSSLVWLEVLAQLPFFVVGAYAFWKKREWVRIPALLYGINVASTMVPIIATLALDPRTDFNRTVLLAIYTPYMLIPLCIAVRVLTAGPKLFPQNGGNQHDHVS